MTAIPVRRRTPSEVEAYQQGAAAGRLQGLGQAIRILIEAGVPPRHHDPIHEAIDRLHTEERREPRSHAVRAERCCLIDPGLGHTAGPCSGHHAPMPTGASPGAGLFRFDRS